MKEEQKTLTLSEIENEMTDLNKFSELHLEKEYGTVNHNGKILYLLQNPYIDQPCNEETAYFASAIGEDLEHYKVRWEIITDDDQGDESNACNWNKYTVTKL